VIGREGPWRSVGAVEFATLEGVDGFNNRRLLEPLGNMPPAAVEARYQAQAERPSRRDPNQTASGILGAVHRRYRERGEDSVLDGRRVSPRLGKGLLTEDEARQARDRITGTTPEPQGLPWALWTRRAGRELIERRLGKRLGLTTVQLHLQPTPAGWPAGGPRDAGG
jgi:hypothetical protein